jgi:hypothetical protein
MLTQLEIEINELSELLLRNGFNCIRISELVRYLRYKEPILLKGISNDRVKNEFVNLFPIHKNKRKNTKYFKLSKKQVVKNKYKGLNRFRPIESVKREIYGIVE